MKDRPMNSGVIVSPGNPLDGCRAIYVARRIGGYLVELLEDRGAYKAGDRVQVGTGEYVTDA